jgi:hypothetical protein
MRCFWEQTGVLGPIYRSLGQGLNDKDIEEARSHRSERRELHCLGPSFLKAEGSTRAGSIRVSRAVALCASWKLIATDRRLAPSEETSGCTVTDFNCVRHGGTFEFAMDRVLK